MHDVSRVLKDLSDAVSQDKGHVGFLLGAGCPAAVRIPDGEGTKALIPDMAGLTSIVAQRLSNEESFTLLGNQFNEDGIPDPNVEQMLTTVRALLRVAGAGTTRGLARPALIALEESICRTVYEVMCTTLPTKDTAYHSLCRWIRDVPRAIPVTLFTTNYDLLLEQALEEEEVAFFDGFSGARQPFFDIRAIEDDILPPRWARVWKLHGSINWRAGGDGRPSVVREMPGAASGGGILIHPSELKYDQSRRMPYLAMFDRLRSFLRSPGAVLVTCGYSFADEHLNEAIIQGLIGNPRAAAFGCLYKKLSEEPAAFALAPRTPVNLSLLAFDKGVIRRRTEEWSSAGEDGGSASESGTPPNGSFGLGDFRALCEFMANLAEAAPLSSLLRS